jgi:N,N'-diacetylchitobiose transport system permease protein
MSALTSTPTMQPAQKRSRAVGEKPLRTGLWNTVAVIFGAVMAFPIYWMFISTIESGRDLLSINPHFFPTSFSLASYTAVFQDPGFWPSLRTTAIITLASVALALTIGFLGAVGVARFKFRGRSFFVMAMMCVQMIPGIALILPLFFVVNDIGLVDQLLGVIIVYLVFTVPYCFWVLRAFIVNIPVELDEAAMVDGCTRLGAFVRIVLPLTLPGLITAGVYSWIQTWNEFLMVNVILNAGDKMNGQMWLDTFSASPLHGANYGEQMAGAFLISLPIIILFVTLQKKLTAGLTAGAVKG